MTKLITVRAAADMLKLSPQRVHQLMKLGRLTAVEKIEGKTGAYLLSLEAVEAYRRAKDNDRTN